MAWQPSLYQKGVGNSTGAYILRDSKVSAWLSIDNRFSSTRS